MAGLDARAECDDFRLVGLKLIFFIVTRAVSVLGPVATGGMEEGRRDLDVAPSARYRARATESSLEVDVDEPGVIGPAGSAAADRHSSMIMRWHRPPPLGTAVPPRSPRTSADTPQWKVDGATAGPVRMCHGVITASTASSRRST